ncbi:hypothetical protein [Aquirhabdus parva]|uniref:hypothetical protein n=1 Tax=Aquirhabdus parva TaxID=2283318 RepID=UPI0013B476E9|nr:hypothetical protein [Aquirhabdus parva]
MTEGHVVSLSDTPLNIAGIKPYRAWVKELKQKSKAATTKKPYGKKMLCSTKTIKDDNDGRNKSNEETRLCFDATVCRGIMGECGDRTHTID